MTRPPSVPTPLRGLSVLIGALLAMMTLLPDRSAAAHLYVGPERDHRTIRSALEEARDGDTVFIEEGLYTNETAVLRQNNLKIIGLGDRPRIVAPDHIPNGKAIWVIRGDNVLLRNLDMSGARVRDMNGAAIRHEGGHLQIESSIIHHNQMGVLTANKAASSLTILNSSIHSNHLEKRGRRIGHNVYVGNIARFELSGSHVYDAWIGHNVKSRARETLILHSAIEDIERASSYLIDLPNGGRATIDNCILKKGADSENNALISFGSEGMKAADNWLSVSNTLARGAGQPRLLIRNHSKITPLLNDNDVQGMRPPVQEGGRIARWFQSLKNMIKNMLK